MLEKIKENLPAVLMALALVSSVILSELSLRDAESSRKRIERIRQLEYNNTPLEGDYSDVRPEKKTRGEDSPH